MKKIMKLFLRLTVLIVIIALCVAGYYLYKTQKGMAKVISFKDIVQQELKSAGIPEYSDLALAIIYTETKGKTNDLMQSSESVHGTVGEMKDTRESVKAGVDFLARAIKESKEENCDIWTAVQAYNFGLAYIPFVAEHGGKNTLDLASEYSRDVVAPSLGNTNEEMYTYPHPQAFLYNGGKLYKNGGNLFYAKIVSLNEKILHLFFGNLSE